ncbi:WAP, Kazal, immunoglobulin, Kunitz and NTR domain-containing protein 2-like [Mytilus edulis]|uniref:WAP, Kazal, immunoglobulin, Kunitz and NTR domain-containing protein 2-like n=1 Tax=Mytilus edulis TaxID=6550 RepID=UPI0039F0B808
MHGCSQKSQCSTIAHIIPQGICSFCCDTELCNRNCTIKSTVATPPSTPTTATTTMAPTTPIRHAKIRCLEGVRLTSPLDTSIVTECGDHEVCSVERYVTNDGIIFYNVGCKDRQFCIANPLGPGKGDETLICRHCCDDKDLCNMNQCGARVNLPVGSTICYSCPLAMDANKCNHITLCDRDSACSIKQTQNLIGKPRWSHGCSEKTQCATIAQSNPQGICSFCCDTELCNRNCTIRSTIAPPPTTTTTTMAPTTPINLTAPIITQTVIQPTNIKYGDTVTIQCIAKGNPKPAIDFLVKGRRLGANVHVDPTTHLLTISNFSPYDARDYRCIASNLLGDVHKDIHIQGHT